MRLSVQEKWICSVHVGRKRFLRGADLAEFPTMSRIFSRICRFLSTAKSRKCSKTGRIAPRPIRHMTAWVRGKPVCSVTRGCPLSRHCETESIDHDVNCTQFMFLTLVHLLPVVQRLKSLKRGWLGCHCCYVDPCFG